MHDHKSTGGNMIRHELDALWSPAGMCVRVRRTLVMSASAAVIVFYAAYGGLGVPPARAANLVPANTAAADVYTTDYNATHQGADRWQNLLIQATLQSYYLSNPSATTQQLEEAGEQLNQAITAARTSLNGQYDLSFNMGTTGKALLDVALSAGNVFTGGAASSAADLVKAAINAEREISTVPGENDIGGSASYLAAIDNQTQYWQTNPQADNILATSYALANGGTAPDGNTYTGDPVFAQAIDYFNLQKTSTSTGSNCAITSSVEQCVTSSPAVHSEFETYGWINNSTNEIKSTILTATGALQLENEETQALITQGFANLDASISAANKTLQTLTEGQNALAGNLGSFIEKYNYNEQARKQQEEKSAKAQKEKAEQEVQAKAAAAGVQLLGKFATAAFGPEAGHDVEVAGNAGIQIFGAISSIVGVCSGTVSPLALATAGSSLAGAVSSIAGLFGSKEPTPTQLILNQIKQTQVEIKELGKVTEERFDRVDAALNTLFKTLNEDFAEINTRLGKIEVGLDELKKSLADLQLSVDGLSRNVHEELDAESLRPFFEKEDEGLQWSEINEAHPQLPEEKYDEFNSAFFVQATTFPFQAPGIPIRDLPEPLAPENVLRELEYPLEQDLDYLGEVAEQDLHVTAFHSKLPNPREWALGAEAYAELATEWPEWAANSPHSKRFEEVEAVGRELQSELTSLGHNEGLFTKLVSNAREAASTLDERLGHDEAEFLKTAGSGATPTTFAALDDGPVPYPHVSKLYSACYGEQEGELSVYLPAPVGLENGEELYGYGGSGLSYEPYAEALGLGKADNCVQLTWSGNKVVFHLVTEFLPPGLGVSPYELFEFQFETAQEFSHGGEAPNVFIYPVSKACGDCKDAWDDDGIKAEFERGLQFVRNMPQRCVKTTCSPGLEEFQAMLNEKQVGDLDKLDQLLAADVTSQDTEAVEDNAVMAGADRMLADFTQLAFPTELDSDETLRALIEGPEAVAELGSVKEAAQLQEEEVNTGCNACATEPAYMRLNRRDEQALQLLAEKFAKSDAAVPTVGERAAENSMATAAEEFEELPAGTTEEQPLITDTLVNLEFASKQATAFAEAEGAQGSGGSGTSGLVETHGGAGSSGTSGLVETHGGGGSGEVHVLAYQAPVLSGLSVDPRAIVAGNKKRRHSRTETRISYRDSEAATTTVTVEREEPGRRKGQACVAPTKSSHAERQRCMRFVRVGRLTHDDDAGTNVIVFDGRINGHVLAPGRYRVALVARDTDGLVSKVVMTTLEIIA